MQAHLALLIVTLIYGLFYVAMKLLVTEMTPVETFSLRLLLAVPLLVVLEKRWFNARMPGLGLSGEGWLWMGYVAVFATVGTYALNYYGLARLTPSTVSVYALLQPVVTALFAYWVLAEPITAQMVVQGALILTGVSIATGGYRVFGQWIRSRVTRKAA